MFPLMGEVQRFDEQPFTNYVYSRSSNIANGNSAGSVGSDPSSLFVNPKEGL